MQHDSAALRLLYISGTGTISSSCVRLTGGDVYTWDQIYAIVADALGVEAKLVHVASELFPVVAPEWFWSGEMLGDIGHSAIFDLTKIRRFVPGFAPKLTFHRAALRMIQWRTDHPDTTGVDETTDAVLDRIVDAYRATRDVFAGFAPQPVGAGR